MNTAIYYPHFYPSQEWLKLAALCWDRVYTLRSPDAPSDPEPILALNNTLNGFLDYIDISTIARDSEIQRQFLTWVDARYDLLKSKERSSQLSDEDKGVYGLYAGKFPDYFLVRDLIDRGLARVIYEPQEIQIPIWEKHMRLGEANYDSFRSAYVSYFIASEEGKVEEAAKIREQNLITVTESRGVIYLPKDVALYYLSLCALKAAIDGQRDLIAEGEEFTDVVFHKIHAVRGEVALSALQAYLPDNLYDLDVRVVAELRHELATKRIRYQNAIQSLSREFSDVASEGQLENLKGRMVDLAKKRIEDTKRAYQRNKLKISIKALGLSLTPPAIAASIASALGLGVFEPTGIAAALSIFAASSLIEYAEARSVRDQSPWSYVLEIANRA